MFQKKPLLEEDEYSDELSYFDQSFDEEISEEQFDFGDHVFSFLQDLIDTEELQEQFTSENNLKLHFRTHCLAGVSKRKSRRSKVYYDFTNLQDYSNHEQEICDRAISTIKSNGRMFIEDLYDTDKVIKAFRKLFEGNQTLVFSLSCGFHNVNGVVRLCLHSFATDYTNNYPLNTVDFLIQSSKNETISIYPVDANYLENKINNEIAKIPENILLPINH